MLLSPFWREIVWMIDYASPSHLLMSVLHYYTVVVIKTDEGRTLRPLQFYHCAPSIVCLAFQQMLKWVGIALHVVSIAHKVCKQASFVRGC